MSMLATAQNDTRLLLEGWLPLWVIALLGVVLVGHTCVLAARDLRRLDHRPWVLLLALARSTALVALLWMLASPSSIVVTRKTHLPTIAVLVDRSDSMGQVEFKDGTGDLTRWTAASDSTPHPLPLRELDGAVAMLRIAIRQLERFSTLPASADHSTAQALLGHALEGLETGLAEVQRGANELPSRASEVRRGLASTVRAISNDALKVLRARQDELQRGVRITAMERDQWLPSLLEGISKVVDNMERLSDLMVAEWEGTPSNTQPEIATETARSTRFEKVQKAMAEAESAWLKDLRKKANISRYEFAGSVSSLGAAPWTREISSSGDARLGNATQIGAALARVASDHVQKTCSAVILITDGGQNAGPDPKEAAAALGGIPLLVVPVGNTSEGRDAFVREIRAPKSALPNDTISVEAAVAAVGCMREELIVELLVASNVVDRQTIPVTQPVFDNPVPLHWKGGPPGLHTLTVRIESVNGERTGENNSASTDVQVVHDKMRILVADNYPRWETRYLLNLLKRDSQVTCDQLLFEPQLVRGPGARSSLPATISEWSQYRVVILGDLLPDQLSMDQQQLLRDYVTAQGGNLIVIAGKEAMPAAFINQPLGALLPVEKSGHGLATAQPFDLSLSDEGSRASPVQIADPPGASARMWREMSEHLPIYSLSQFSKPKLTAHVLIWASQSKAAAQVADENPRAFLAWHYVGAGRVVYLAAPVTWQLRAGQGDSLHYRFWGQILRWIMARDLAEGSRLVQLNTDKLRYEQGESVRVSAQLRQTDGTPLQNALLQVQAWRLSNMVQEIVLMQDSLRPGTYTGVLDGLPAGPLKIRASGDHVKALLASEQYLRPVETAIDIDRSSGLETLDTLCNRTLLREIAASAGGVVVPPTGLEGAVKQLQLEPQTSEVIARQSLWNRWDLMWIFIACLSFEWAGRKYLRLD